MPYDSSNYFAYKKNKYRKDITQPPKPISKINFLFQLFIVTFIVMFVAIVFLITKYSPKIDIENIKKDDKLKNNLIENTTDNSENQNENERQLKIDKRLILIQQEENAPSEAKIIEKDINKNEIIDPIYLENNKKIEKEEKLKESVTKVEEKETAKTEQKETLAIDNKNITIMSKVLVGRFSSFEEAQSLQEAIKSKDASLSPYVKKIGEVFTVQLGSYQDFEIAKKQARTLKSKGLDVWIYQQ